MFLFPPLNGLEFGSKGQPLGPHVLKEGRPNDCDHRSWHSQSPVFSTSYQQSCACRFGPMSPKKRFHFVSNEGRFVKALRGFLDTESTVDTVIISNIVAKSMRNLRQSRIGLMMLKQRSCEVRESTEFSSTGLNIRSKALPFVGRRRKVFIDGRARGSRDIVAFVVHKIIGREYGRKRISIHLRVLKNVTVRNDVNMEHPELKKGMKALGFGIGLESDLQMLSDFPATASFLDSLLTTPRFKIDFTEFLSIHPEAPVSNTKVALTMVSRQIRTEAFKCLDSHLSFNFHDDIDALKHFHTVLSAQHKSYLRNIHIKFIEGRDHHSSVQSSDLVNILNRLLPNLELLHITLDPRLSEHTIGEQYPWGPESTTFLSTLSQATAMVVRLSLKWQHDCMYFEEDHMVQQGWTQFPEADDQLRAEFRAAT